MSMNDVVNQARFTVLIGKNGSGKSTLLRALNAYDRPNVKYVSPERGGTLKYDPNVDNNISANIEWLKTTRQANRFEQFRQQSAAQFRNLETAVLREIEQKPEKRADVTYTFGAILEQINGLLPAIKMVRNDRAGFSIQTKAGNPVDEEHISSGESELIALAIEVLVFSGRPCLASYSCWTSPMCICIQTCSRSSPPSSRRSRRRGTFASLSPPTVPQL